MVFSWSAAGQSEAQSADQRTVLVAVLFSGATVLVSLEKPADGFEDFVRREASQKIRAGKVEVTMTGTGDADLYVRRGTAPDVDTFDCRARGGDSDARALADAVQKHFDHRSRYRLGHRQSL